MLRPRGSAASRFVAVILMVNSISWADPVLDVHVHLAALPDGKNGCLMSEKMKSSPVVRFLAWELGIPLNDPARANLIYLNRLVDTLRGSQYVQQAVLLAIDGVYGPDGDLDRDKTAFMVPNDAVFAAVKKYPDLFQAGVSINPQRKDALQELERCATNG